MAPAGSRGGRSGDSVRRRFGTFGGDSLGRRFSRSSTRRRQADLGLGDVALPRHAGRRRARRGRAARRGAWRASPSARATLVAAGEGDRRVGRVDAGLARPEPRVAVLEQLLVGSGRSWNGLHLFDGGADPQQVPDLVEHVGAHHLPEEVVRDRLEAGEAAAPAAVAGVGRRAARSPSRAGRCRSRACGRPGSGAAGAAASRWPARRAASAAQLVQLVPALAQRLGGGHGGLAQLAQRGPGGGGERARAGCSTRLERPGAARWRSASSGSDWPASSPSAHERRAAARPGTRACGAPTRARASRREATVSARSAPSVTNRRASRREPSSAVNTVSASAMNCWIVRLSSPRMRSTLRRLAQARVRAPQHLLEVLGAPREARCPARPRAPAAARAWGGAARSGSGRSGSCPRSACTRDRGAVGAAARAPCRAGSPRSTRRSATAASPSRWRRCGTRARPPRSPRR